LEGWKEGRSRYVEVSRIEEWIDRGSDKGRDRTRDKWSEGRRDIKMDGGRDNVPGKNRGKGYRGR
jgi:hypothetical protein